MSGSGSTADNGNPTGLGNLIIGYDEDPTLPISNPSNPPLGPGDRGGSHNLVIGSFNRFTQVAFGGFVAGERNIIEGTGASVLGGFHNTANRSFSSVSGGSFNFASGSDASILGGQSNTASGDEATVCGGNGNTAFCLRTPSATASATPQLEV